MKKFALYFLAAAALFVGCSEKNIEPSVNAEDAWMYDASLPVPIKFTMGEGSLTKGTQVASLDDMVGKKFGFYAVNSGRDADNMGTYTTAIPALLETGWKQGVGATCQLVDGKYMFDDALDASTANGYLVQHREKSILPAGWHLRQIPMGATPQCCFVC